MLSHNIRIVYITISYLSVGLVEHIGNVKTIRTDTCG